MNRHQKHGTLGGVLDSVGPALDINEIVITEKKEFDRLLDEVDLEKEKFSRSITALEHPPIRNGLMSCFFRLQEILLGAQFSNTSMEEIREVCEYLPEPSRTYYDNYQIPRMILRVKKLLHIYYSYQIFGEDSPDIKYCDLPSREFATYSLFNFGKGIATVPAIMPRIMSQFPAFVEFVFSIQETHPRCQSIIERYHHYRENRPERKERKKLYRDLVYLQLYQVTHHLLYFLTPIWIRLSMPTLFSQESEWTVDRSKLSKRAMSTLVAHTSTLNAILANGSAAFLAIQECHIKSRWIDEDWVTRFRRAGGIPGCLHGSVSSPMRLS